MIFFRHRAQSITVPPTRARRLAQAGAVVAVAAALAWRPSDAQRASVLSQIVGRASDRSFTVSLLAATDMAATVEYGPADGAVRSRAAVAMLTAGRPAEIEVTGLTPNRAYVYRVRYRTDGGDQVTADATVHTQRAAGASFTFGVQGDSHPERAGRMYDAALYQQTLAHAAAARPDLYFMLGDDFSIERLISRTALTQGGVDQVYADQRPFLTAVARSAALYLVNGNHEEAAGYLLDGTPTSAPVLAGRARNAFYPLPAPDRFFSGNAEPIEHVGLPRDYYAFAWGDALFVVIDPYWHSRVQVDAAAGGGGGGGGGGRRGGQRGGGNASRAVRPRDNWGITLGDAQYAWLQHTLETSGARYKFVFAHHVLGTGRGGIEVADGFEWGGRDPRGGTTFAVQRPAWPLPIHQLMVKSGVSIFFQGHDHLFARQQKDGVVYQSVPNPADPTYQAFNREAYRSGDVLPNSGFLRVDVTRDSARVSYVRSFAPGAASAPARDGDVAFSYLVRPGR